MKQRLLRACRRLVLGLGLTSLVASPLSATWSIVAVDTATGEVVVATATCLNNFDIQDAVPVIAVGYGAAATQALLNSTGSNKPLIVDGLHNGLSPQEILDVIEQADSGWQQRQFGVVDFFHEPAAHTGNAAGQGKKHETGVIGTIRYSIQGNVLAGAKVVQGIENAFKAPAPGADLGQRVMEAMEAGRFWGGDGRCSCSALNPTNCGVPPASFTKSAHCATIVLARFGDTDGGCNGAVGCADGNYYLNLNVIGSTADPDPVIELQSMYDAWRQTMLGHPDHIRTEVVASASSLPADGLTPAFFTIHPKDVDGNPIAGGGATVTVSRVGGGPFFAAPSLVFANPDGSYTFSVTAGTQPGMDEYEIVIDDGTTVATLYPYPSMAVEPAGSLHAGLSAFSASAGAEVHFVTNAGAAAGDRPYILLGSSAGTAPGIPLGFQTVPLNPDPFLDFTILGAGPPVLPGSIGVTDANGRADAWLVAAPGAFLPGVGLHLDFATVVLGPPETITQTVGVDVLP